MEGFKRGLGDLTHRDYIAALADNAYLAWKMLWRAVQIYDLGNSSHARDARESKRKRRLNGCSLLPCAARSAWAAGQDDEIGV